jgi:hypothetical protein
VQSTLARRRGVTQFENSGILIAATASQKSIGLNFWRPPPYKGFEWLAEFRRKISMFRAHGRT